MKVFIEDFRAFKRNTLLGFASVRLPGGIVIHDVPLNAHGTKAWVMPPGRPYVDDEGTLIRAPSGKPKYVATISFSTDKDRKAFSNAVSMITKIDGVFITKFDVLPTSASRHPVGVLGSGSGK